MTDREILIELLKRACRFDCSNEYCQKWHETCVGRTADFLLANGVMLSNIETNIYDSEEIHHNCTVQILTNSVTGEQSIGWWEENEHRWISVENRLPEKDDYYLCCVKSFCFPGRSYVNILEYYKDGFKEGHIYTDSVTHWMPLPEPPKET